MRVCERLYPHLEGIDGDGMLASGERTLVELAAAESGRLRDLRGCLPEANTLGDQRQHLHDTRRKVHGGGRGTGHDEADLAAGTVGEVGR